MSSHRPSQDWILSQHHRDQQLLRALFRISARSGIPWASLPIHSEDIHRVGYTDEESYRDILDYLQNMDPDEGMPDAFVCDDDPIAFGALRAFAQCGIRVPEDVSIIGFNNHSNCQITKPPLTSVEVRSDGFLPGSIDLLAELIRKKSGSTGKNSLPISQKIRFATNLVIRDSVKNRK
jgi:LacI family transcriptional regulator